MEPIQPGLFNRHLGLGFYIEFGKIIETKLTRAKRLSNLSTLAYGRFRKREKERDGFPASSTELNFVAKWHRFGRECSSEIWKI